MNSRWVVSCEEIVRDEMRCETRRNEMKNVQTPVKTPRWMDSGLRTKKGILEQSRCCTETGLDWTRRVEKGRGSVCTKSYHGRHHRHHHHGLIATPTARPPPCISIPNPTAAISCEVFQVFFAADTARTPTDPGDPRRRRPFLLRSVE
jgi:hypothetical protein